MIYVFIRRWFGSCINSFIFSLSSPETQKKATMQENRYDGGGGACYFVFMNYDPEYERLRADRCVWMNNDLLFEFETDCFVFLVWRSGEGAHELDEYLSRKHDGVLGRCLEPGTYRKVSSFLIVDGFSVEITEEQVLKVSFDSY